MIPGLVLLPMLAFALCWLAPRHRSVVAVGASLLNFLLCGRLAWEVMQYGPRSFVAGGWAEAAGIVFQADGLSAILLMTGGFTGLVITIYALAFFRVERHYPLATARRFWLLWLALLAGLNGLFLSTNLLLMLLFLELIGGAAVGLVALSGTRRAKVVALRYYFARLPGSLGFFLGIAFLYVAFGTLEIRALAGQVEAAPLISVAAGLMVLGVVVKASLFPFHFWLPNAHSGAIGPASAMLSGVVVKGPFYVALRLWFDLFPEIVTPSAAQVIGTLGAVGIIWGAAQALRSTRLKLIIAHSTVSQMGFLFLLFPLLTGLPGTAWTTTAWTGGLYQVMSHAMAKAALLLAAGVVLYSLGSDKLRDMHGIASRLPVTTFAIALACVTLIGLPPSGGFIGKWLLLSAVIESGQWWWIPALIGGALLTAAYAFLMLSYAFRSRPEEPHVIKPVPRLMEVTALVLALAAIVIGLRVQEPMRLIEPIADPAGLEQVEEVEPW